MKTKIFLNVLMLLCASLILGCSNEEPTMKETAFMPPVFYYYPNANVYYDTVSKTYTYTTPDAGSWQTGKEPPYNFNADSETKVLLTNVANPVWKENEQHRMVYAVSLYATPVDLMEEPKEEETMVPGIKQRAQADKEPKTGVGKFLKKLFDGKEERSNN